MCGGASRVNTKELNLPRDIEYRLINNGLATAQNIIDEGSDGLKTIGLSEHDIAGISEAVHQETGEWIG